MADNPKERMQKHRTNKKKYKSKPGGPIQKSKQPVFKSKPVLESNWDRYENEEVNPEINIGTDFAILANAPITQGSHFQFKSDKKIAEESTSPNLFNLDLNLLGRSLLTIPFHIRSGIDEEVFTATQKRIMMQKSKSNEYLTFLENYDVKAVGNSFFGSDGEDSESDDNSKSENNTLPDLPVELTTVPSSHSELEFHIKEEPTVKSTEEDLEHWLDDILDD